MEEPTSRWRPVLTDEDAMQATNIVSSIAEALTNSPLLRLCGSSLSRGAAGAALFFAYYAETDGASRANALSHSWLSYALRDVLKSPNDLRLYAGATGVAWVISHLDRLHVRLVTKHDLPSEMDRTLLARLVGRPRSSQFDLVSGLVGHAVYALERLNNPAGPAMLNAIINRLSECAITRPEGITWWADPEPQAEERPMRPQQFNLGLAHGIPGAIAALSDVYRLEIGGLKARYLLRDAVNWLLAQRNDDSTMSTFDALTPAYASTSMRRGGSRLAWCYGDLGISIALYRAALALKEPHLAQQAVAIARRAAQRSLENSGVRDACLCHGSAGVAHLFNRLYQATGESAFLDAGRTWLRRTLQFYHPNHGLGGYRAWLTPRQSSGTWTHPPGFLMGTAGIGLALLAAITRTEPLWDRTLLVTLPTAHAS
jgi:lantibiotic biosynthesis protein